MQSEKNKSAVRLLLISTFLLWFSVYTYPSFLSVYASDVLGATTVMVGAIVGSYGMTQMILRIPLGIYSDMIRKRKPFMLMGMLASTIAALGLFAFKFPAGALIFRGMAGVAASTWVTFSVMYSSLFSQKELSFAMGRLSMVQFGSQLIAMLLGGFIANNMGEGAAFLLAALAGVAGMIVVSTIRDVPPSTPPQTVQSLIGVAKNKRLLVATGLSVLFHFVCWGTVLGFTANWAQKVVGLDKTQLGMLSAMYLLPNTLMPRFSSGIWSDKIGSRNVVLIGFLIVAAACALFTQAYTMIGLFAVQAMFGIGMALIVPITLAEAIADITPEKRGAAMGFYQSIYGIGMFIGPVVAGWVIDAASKAADLTAGYSANFLVMAGVAFAGMILTAILMPNRRKEG